MKIDIAISLLNLTSIGFAFNALANHTSVIFWSFVAPLNVLGLIIGIVKIYSHIPPVEKPR